MICIVLTFEAPQKAAFKRTSVMLLKKHSFWSTFSTANAAIWNQERRWMFSLHNEHAALKRLLCTKHCQHRMWQNVTTKLWFALTSLFKSLLAPNAFVPAYLGALRAAFESFCYLAARVEQPDYGRLKRLLLATYRWHFQRQSTTNFNLNFEFQSSGSSRTRNSWESKNSHPIEFPL